MPEKYNRISNNSLGIWRIFFTLSIMLYHFSSSSSIYTDYPMIKKHWYISVEFFFILSGYLLMQHIEHNKEESIGAYLSKRIYRLYPEYVIAFIVMAFIRAANQNLNVIKVIIPNWLELVMLQNIGTGRYDFVNSPAWYVSTLLIASLILFYMLKEHRKVFLEFIAPIGMIVIFSYLYREYAFLDVYYQTKGFLLNGPVMRALLGMTVGIYVYLISTSEPVKRFFEKVRGFCILIEIVFFIGALSFATLVEDGEYDYLILILFAIGILCASQDMYIGKICKIRVIKWLDEISYSAFLCHNAVIALGFYVFKIFKWQLDAVSVILFILITLIVASVYHYLCKGIRIIIKKKSTT